jgi:transcriptional regulator with XRE-family HTH domain
MHAEPSPGTAFLDHLRQLGACVRTYRRDLGYTYAQFGCVVGMSEEHLRRLETGTWSWPPSRRLRARLEDMLGITLPAVPPPAPAPRRRRAAPVSRRAPQTLGERLRQRRLALELGQATVAARMHVHVTAICRWEKDRARPSARMLARLACALECPVTFLTQETPCLPMISHSVS